MNPRWWLVGALLATTGCLVVERLLQGGPAHPGWLWLQIESSKAAGLAGCLAAAWAFGRGDYLRRAWLWMAVCMGVLLLTDATQLVPDGWETTAIVTLRGALVTLANVAAVIGTWMLARAWRVAGLELPGGRLAAWGLGLGAVTLAAVLAGPSVLTGGGRLLDGDWNGLEWIASGLGDLICLCLIAPVMLTALALRGGRLGWPWGIYTGSMLAWLLYDAVAIGLPLLEVSEATVTAASEPLRCLACLLTSVAGLAQRWVVLRLRAD